MSKEYGATEAKRDAEKCDLSGLIELAELWKYEKKQRRIWFVIAKAMGYEGDGTYDSAEVGEFVVGQIEKSRAKVRARALEPPPVVAGREEMMAIVEGAMLRARAMDPLDMHAWAFTRHKTVDAIISLLGGQGDSSSRASHAATGPGPRIAPEAEPSATERIKTAVLAPMVAPVWVQVPFGGDFYAEMYARHALEEVEATDRLFEGDWGRRIAVWLATAADMNGPPQGSYHHVCHALARAALALSAKPESSQ